MTVQSEAEMRKLALTSLAGTSIEWFDFFLYGTAAALVFPVLFFSEDMPRYVSLIASFSTFAVGFLARPLGGVIFGHYGDRFGRKKALIIALTLMGASTTLIGLLPTYSQIGFLAPLLLVFFRFIQGLAVGGQWGGAMLLVTENAPANRRGFYGAFAQAGAPTGLVLANLAFIAVSTSMSEQDFMSWGWRLPFVASIVLIALSLYIQLTIEDTEVFRRLSSSARESKQEVQKSPVIRVVKQYPREILLAAGAFLAVQVSFYIFVTFAIAYGTDYGGVGLSETEMLLAVLVSSAMQIPGVFYFSHLSDRIGRRKIYMAGAILMGGWSFVVFPLMDTGSIPLIVLGLGVAQIIISMMYGPQAAMLAELFATEVRYSGASLGYQLGAIVGGGAAPIVATAILASTGETIGISIYIALASLITWVSIFLLKETNTRSL